MFRGLGFEDFKWEGNSHPFKVFRLCPMSPRHHIIDFQTMTMRLGVILDRVRGVLGVISRLVGVSRKRRGIFVRISFRLLGLSCRFSFGFEALFSGLEGP